jgi:uncharacterized membrane protein YidH (DUF202 family)
VSGPSPQGRQLERTALSWQRTALSAAVVALLLLREGLREGARAGWTNGTALTAVAGLCLVALAVLAAVAARAGRTAGQPRLVLAGAVLVGVAGVLSVVQLAISP